jgi:hypothetical protein
MSTLGENQHNGGLEGDNSPLHMNEQVPQENDPRRTACVICRKRKLACDGAMPACERCTRLGHDCSYDRVSRKHKKPGIRKGYVRGLEIRLGALS